MLFMYGIKLPRKRKKAFLAYFAKKNQNSELTNEEYALQCYCSQGLVCEILWGEKKLRKNRSFYDYNTKSYRVYVRKKF
jgi:hypothetical protein